METLKELLYSRNSDQQELGHIVIGFGVAIKIKSLPPGDLKLKKLQMIDELTNYLLFYPDKAGKYCDDMLNYLNTPVGNPGFSFYEFIGIGQNFSPSTIELINDDYNKFYKAYKEFISYNGG